MGNPNLVEIRLPLRHAWQLVRIAATKCEALLEEARRADNGRQTRFRIAAFQNGQSWLPHWFIGLLLRLLPVTDGRIPAVAGAQAQPISKVRCVDCVDLVSPTSKAMPKIEENPKADKTAKVVSNLVELSSDSARCI